jgi:hypothetical protein
MKCGLLIGLLQSDVARFIPSGLCYFHKTASGMILGLIGIKYVLQMHENGIMGYVVSQRTLVKALMSP